MHNAQFRSANLSALRKKRSRNPELRAFGRALASFRGTHSREWISRKLEDLGVPLGGSTIAQYEKGTVWAPDPGVLWGLATIYEQPLELLVTMLRANRAEPMLESFEHHDLLTQTRPPHTSSDERLRAAGKELEDVARHLATLAMSLQGKSVNRSPARRSQRTG